MINATGSMIGYIRTSKDKLLNIFHILLRKNSLHLILILKVFFIENKDDKNDIHELFQLIDYI